MEEEDNKSPETDEARAERLALARAKKAEKAQERHQEAAQEREARRARIEAQLPAISERWNRAFTVAMRENTDAAWQHCESLMVAYVGAKRALAK